MARAANEIDARQEIPPLVVAARLHRTVEMVEEMQEVDRLEDHVAELGVRDALGTVFQPRAHGLLGDHHIDGEVLADVAQVLDQRHLAEPVGVVHHHRAVLALEREKRFELAANQLGVRVYLLSAEQHALLRFEAGVADHPGPAANQQQWAMPGALKVGQHHDRHEIADLQAWPRWIPPAIDREHARCRRLWQTALSHLADQAALLKHGDHILWGCLRLDHCSANLFLTSSVIYRTGGILPAGAMHGGVPTAPGNAQAQTIVRHPGTETQEGTRGKQEKAR